jgi:hypothetical protein
MDDMGILYTPIAIASVSVPETRHELTDVMVDAGSEYNFFPCRVLTDLGRRELVPAGPIPAAPPLVRAA